MANICSATLFIKTNKESIKKIIGDSEAGQAYFGENNIVIPSYAQPYERSMVMDIEVKWMLPEEAFIAFCEKYLDDTAVCEATVEELGSHIYGKYIYKKGKFSSHFLASDVVKKYTDGPEDSSEDYPNYDSLDDALEYLLYNT